MFKHLVHGRYSSPPRLGPHFVTWREATCEAHFVVDDGSAQLPLQVEENLSLFFFATLQFKSDLLLICLLNFSLTSLLICLLTCLLNNSLAHLITYSLTHSLTCLLACLLTLLLIYLVTYSCDKQRCEGWVRAEKFCFPNEVLKQNKEAWQLAAGHKKLLPWAQKASQKVCT